MSLINCKECGHSISAKAASCPSCGAVAAPSSGRVVMATVAAVGFGFVAAVVAGTVFVMNGYQSIAVPGIVAFAFGALVGWKRVIK